MNSKTKGCLIAATTFILILVCTIFLVSNIINKSFKKDKSKVDKSWEMYVTILHNRNKMLSENEELKNILPLTTKIEENLKKNLKKELIKNEYKINDSMRKYKLDYSFNKKLNDCLIEYNSSVKEFNNKYSTFPYNFIRIKNAVPLYDYFDIIYGIDNSAIIEKNKKIDDWIENGGELKFE